MLVKGMQYTNLDFFFFIIKQHDLRLIFLIVVSDAKDVLIANHLSKDLEKRCIKKNCDETFRMHNFLLER